MRTGFRIACIAILTLAGCAASRPAPVSPTQASLTVLYDAFGKPSAMRKDWGYAALIEYRGKRILFDTGNDAATLEQNARALHIDLSRLDFVVMSHRHGDHMGGMSYLLRANPKVKIYAPKENFGVYGADLPSSFYRKDASLPPEQRYFDGTPPDIMRFGSAWPNANLSLIDKTTEIMPGLHLIALVSDKPGTLELRELSLAISTPDGIVLVVGCSHPGIDRIVQASAEIDPHIRLIAGGLHLVVAQDAEIARIAGMLHDTYKVDYIAPGHCTGEATFNALRHVFGTHDLYAGLGTVIQLGRMESAQSAGHDRAALDDTDLESYRALLARSDEMPERLAQR